MRITGGLARSIVLDVPSKGEVRPATDFVRERIFGRLATAIQGACVLDCFAGTGAYGLEALSRGAQHVCFLEKDPQVVPILRANCEKVCKSLQRDPASAIKIFSADVFHFDLSHLELPINYIFLDPPYRFWEECTVDVLHLLEVFAQSFPESRLVIEYPAQFIWTEQIPWKPIYPAQSRKKKDTPEINVFRRR